MGDVGADLVPVSCFKTGRWADIDWTPEHLAKIVENHDALRGQVRIPIKLGHSTNQIFASQGDGDPSLGWVEDLEVAGDGKSLTAYVSGMPKALREMVQRGNYRTCSVELWPAFEKTEAERNLKTGCVGPTLAALAMLGADRPCVKGLDDLNRWLAGEAKVVLSPPSDGTVLITFQAQEGQWGDEDQKLADGTAPDYNRSFSTSPDPTDGHVHEVAGLDGEGNGESMQAGNPMHTHLVGAGQVQPYVSSDGTYMSVHPGGLIPAGGDAADTTGRDNGAKYAEGWDESKHPREAAGSPTGGEFSGGGSGAGDKLARAQAAYDKMRKGGLDTVPPEDVAQAPLAKAPGGAPRQIGAIARDIARAWSKQGKGVNYAAKPYLEAMHSLGSVKDNYGADSGHSVVSYFLSNASGFKGPEAKALKGELKAHLLRAGYKMSEDQDGNPVWMVAKREDVNPDAGKSAYGDVTFADEKNKKYPLDTESHVRSALSYFSMAKNRAKYGPEDQKTIMAKIKAAAKRHGIDVAATAADDEKTTAAERVDLAAKEKDKKKAEADAEDEEDAKDAGDDEEAEGEGDDEESEPDDKKKVAATEVSTDSDARERKRMADENDEKVQLNERLAALETKLADEMKKNISLSEKMAAAEAERAQARKDAQKQEALNFVEQRTRRENYRLTPPQREYARRLYELLDAGTEVITATEGVEAKLFSEAEKPRGLSARDCLARLIDAGPPLESLAKTLSEATNPVEEDFDGVYKRIVAREKLDLAKPEDVRRAALLVMAERPDLRTAYGSRQ